MGNGVIKLKTSGTLINTSKRREWWGWLGSMVWLYFMMFGYNYFIYPKSGYGEGCWHPFIFMVVSAMAIITFGLRFAKDPDGLTCIAFYTAPVAIAITVVFALLTPPLGSALYLVSPVFMAPLLTRRVFGAIHTAEPGKQHTRYMSAITVCVIFFALWIIMEPPKEVAFLVPVLFTVPAWLGIRRTITIPNESPSVGGVIVSKRLLLILVSVVILLFWLNLMSTVIYLNIVDIGIETSDTLIILLNYICPVVGFLLYGIINDKGYERAGFISGMMLFVFGIFIALLSGDPNVPWLLPLTLTNGMGGSYFEFFILTIPIFFFNNTKRPVFTASLGVVANLVSSALLQVSSIWMPDTFLTFGTPVLFTAAISFIGCTVLVFFLFERHREKTLAAALYVLLHGGENVLEVQANEIVITETVEKQGAAAAGLTQDEIAIALLLIEGKTRSEITRKLHLKAADANDLMKSIRNKISGIGDPDPVITAIVEKYKLTGRETDMLRLLRNGMTNPQIAAELVISEATVKNHVHNLMKKLPVSSRKEIPSWLETVGVLNE